MTQAPSCVNFNINYGNQFRNLSLAKSDYDDLLGWIALSYAIPASEELFVYVVPADNSSHIRLCPRLLEAIFDTASRQGGLYQVTARVYTGAQFLTPLPVQPVFTAMQLPKSAKSYSNNKGQSKHSKGSSNQTSLTNSAFYPPANPYGLPYGNPMMYGTAMAAQFSQPHPFPTPIVAQQQVQSSLPGPQTIAASPLIVNSPATAPLPVPTTPVSAVTPTPTAKAVHTPAPTPTAKTAPVAVSVPVAVPVHIDVDGFIRDYHISTGDLDVLIESNYNSSAAFEHKGGNSYSLPLLFKCTGTQNIGKEYSLVKIAGNGTPSSFALPLLKPQVQRSLSVTVDFSSAGKEEFSFWAVKNTTTGKWIGSVLAVTILPLQNRLLVKTLDYAQAVSQLKAVK